MQKTSFILDSGAFSVMNNPKAKPIDIDAYAEYVDSHKNVFDYCFNLDVIHDGKASYENWIYLTKQGLDVIPVYHVGTDEKWLKKYLRKTDYVGIGAIANLNTHRRVTSLLRIWKKYLVDSDQMPVCKVHGLGLTSFNILVRFPWYSVDAASGAKAAAYGKIYMPYLYQEDGIWKRQYSKGSLLAVSDQLQHLKGKGGSYFTATYSLKEQYKKFIEEHGYTIGTISPNKRRPRTRNVDVKEKNRKIPKPALFEIAGIEKQRTEELTKEDKLTNLTESYEARYNFNIEFWEEVATRLPDWPRPLHMAKYPVEEEKNKTGSNKTIVYTSIASKNHLKPILAKALHPKVLISYAIISEGFLDMLKTFKKEER